MTTAAQLAQIAAIADQKQKTEQYKAALQSIVTSASVEACRAFVDHMLSDDVPLVVSRQLLQLFAQEISKLPKDVHKPVATLALERIQPRVVSFEEPVAVIRESLAEVLEAEEEWSKAASILSGIDLDSGMRNIDPGYKLAKNIKIAMLYLEDDDPVSSEMFIKKASALIAGSKDPALELQYKTCYARILDSKRRFLEAAGRYYELSQVGGPLADKIDAADLSTSLTAAITCAILAAAGPQRSRILSALYKDERADKLAVFPFLEKVYLERILRREEVQSFAQTLRPHQLAALPDGTTVLDRAVSQHNLLAASKLYNNISLQELGGLLGVAPERAEGIAADMIADGRLRGSIDQVEAVIHFDNKEDVLVQWDAQIQGVCHKLNDIVDTMVTYGIKTAA